MARLDASLLRGTKTARVQGRTSTSVCSSRAPTIDGYRGHQAKCLPLVRRNGDIWTPFGAPFGAPSVLAGGKQLQRKGVMAYPAPSRLVDRHVVGCAPAQRCVLVRPMTEYLTDRIKDGHCLFRESRPLTARTLKRPDNLGLRLTCSLPKRRQYVGLAGTPP